LRRRQRQPGAATNQTAGYDDSLLRGLGQHHGLQRRRYRQLWRRQLHGRLLDPRRQSIDQQRPGGKRQALDGEQHLRNHADTNANANSDTDTNSDADTDTDTDADTDADTDTDTDTDTVSVRSLGGG
jgi:hypothetical protein